VQLFSRPQAVAAIRTKTEPNEKVRLPASPNERSMLAAVMTAIPFQSLFETGSPNMMNAMIAVAAISKLLSSEAFEAVVIPSPTIRSIGAMMSRIIIRAT
jgi:hypothetical protein